MQVLLLWVDVLRVARGSAVLPFLSGMYFGFGFGCSPVMVSRALWVSILVRPYCCRYLDCEGLRLSVLDSRQFFLGDCVGGRGYNWIFPCCHSFLRVGLSSTFSRLPFSSFCFSSPVRGTSSPTPGYISIFVDIDTFRFCSLLVRSIFPYCYSRAFRLSPSLTFVAGCAISFCFLRSGWPVLCLNCQWWRFTFIRFCHGSWSSRIRVECLKLPVSLLPSFLEGL